MAKYEDRFVAFDEIIGVPFVQRTLKRHSEESSSNDNENACSSKKSKSEPESYEGNSVSKCTLTGVVFQVKLLMLFINRALNKGYEFTIATEMVNARKFDDIVYRYKDDKGNILYSLLQAKHRCNKITVNDLLANKTKLAFSLLVYFLAYCNIKKNHYFQDGTLKDLIICTNSDFDFTVSRKRTKSGEEDKRGIGKNNNNERWSKYFETKDLSKEEILFVGSGIEGKMFVTTELPNIVREIVDSCKKLQPTDKIYKKMKEERKNFKNDEWETMMKEFLEKITFVTNYLNEIELGEVIESELGKRFNLLDASFINDSFEVKIMKWLKDFNEENKESSNKKNKSAPFFTRKAGEQLLSGIENQIFSTMMSGVSKLLTRELDETNISFLNPLDNCINQLLSRKSHQILCISSGEVRLTAVKVWQTLKSEALRKTYNFLGFGNGFFFISYENFRIMRDLIINCFVNPTTAFLIIACFQEADCKVLEDVCNKLCQKFGNDKKLIKLILIIDKDNSVPKNFIFKNEVISDCKLDFSHLNNDSQIIILKKTIKFQGRIVSLDKLIDSNTAENVIDCKILGRLIENKMLNVGCGIMDDVPEYYIERELFVQNITGDVLDDLRSKNALFYKNFFTDFNGIRGKKFEENMDEFSHSKDLDDLYDCLSNFSFESIDEPNDEKYFFKSNEFKKFCEDNSKFFLAGSPSDNLSLGKLIALTNEDLRDRIYRSFPPYRECFSFRGVDSDQMISSCSDKVLEFLKSSQYLDNILKISNILEMAKFKGPNNKIIILAAEPGEGKSLFMSSITKKFKDSCPDIWIARVNLNDFVERNSHPNLNDIDFNTNEIEKGVDFFTRLVTSKDCEVSLGKKLLTDALSLKRDAPDRGKILHTKVIALFDGFDEICPDYGEKTLNLIGALKLSNIAQIWVTTRFNEAYVLEKKLKTKVYTFCPLAINEQVELFCRYLKNHLKQNLKHLSTNRDSDSRKKIYDNYIALLQEVKSFFKEKRKFPGALQTYELIFQKVLVGFDTGSTENCYKKVRRLLRKYSKKDPANEERIIENFHEELKELCLKKFVYLLLRKWDGLTNNNKEISFFKIPLNLTLLAEAFFENNFKMPNKLNLKELYDKFVQKKRDIYFKEKARINEGNVALAGLHKFMHRYCIKVHEELALKKFGMIENSPKFEEYRLLLSELNPTDELCRVGLMKIQGDKLSFIHRSFAEYFVSRYIFENLRTENVGRLLCEKILIHEEFGLIRRFLNDFLENNTKKLLNLHSKTSDSVLKLIVKEGLIFLVECLLKNFKGDKINIINPSSSSDNRTYDERYYNPLQLAAHYGDTEIFELLFYSVKKDYCNMNISEEELLKLTFHPKGLGPYGLFRLAVESCNSQMIEILFRIIKEIKVSLMSQNNCLDEALKCLVLDHDSFYNTILHHSCFVNNLFPKCTSKLLEGVRNMNKDYLNSLILFEDPILSQNIVHITCGAEIYFRHLKIVLKEVTKHLSSHKDMLRKLIFRFDFESITPVQKANKFQSFDFLDLLLKSLKNPEDESWRVTFKDSFLDPYDISDRYLVVISGSTKSVVSINELNAILGNIERDFTTLFFFVSKRRVDEIKKIVKLPVYNCPINNRDLETLIDYNGNIRVVVNKLFSEFPRYSNLILWVDKHVQNNITCEHFYLNNNFRCICIRFSQYQFRRYETEAETETEAEIETETETEAEIKTKTEIETN